MTPEEKLRAFRSSYSRCTLDPDFITTFHKIFITTSSNALYHFSHIPEERQVKMLEYALYLLMLSVDDNPDAMTCLEQLGKSHERLTIKPELYDHWLNSLVTAVDNYDGKSHPNIGGIWRDVLGPGLELMKKQTAEGVKLKAIS